MTDLLKKDIEALLTAHPELKNGQLVFNADEPVFTPNSVQNIAACKLKDDAPAIIKGQSSKIEVRLSPVHGYGVFAKAAINEAELIEECRLLKLAVRMNYIHDAVINDYVWTDKNCNCNDCKTHGKVGYLALGLGSLYNHADEPNTTQQLNFKTEVMTIHARRNIAAGEELFVTYGDKYFLIREFMRRVKQNGDLEKKLKERKEMQGE